MPNNNGNASIYKVKKPYSYIPCHQTQKDNKSRKQNADEYYRKKYDINGKTILHTGVLHCTLEIITPLAIPDVFRVNKNNHKICDFFMENGVLTIPGSSLRGMLRSVYETVTNSCCSMVSKPDKSDKQDKTEKSDKKMDDEIIEVMLKELDRCNSRTFLCEACLLFGMVGDGKEDKSLGSRIRVTDAHVKENSKEKTFKPDPVTLKELYQPKYSVEKNEDGDLEFSGRKYYWHKENPEKSDYHISKKTERNVSIGMIEPEDMLQFDFYIYYDEIREEQLDKLLWVITLGQNKLSSELNDGEELICHKLGRGKPLGLGSVKIKVNKNIERIFDSSKYGMDKRNIDIKKYEGEAFNKVKNVCSLKTHYMAKIKSFSKPKKSSSNQNNKYDKYKIEIQGAPEFKNKTCFLSVPAEEEKNLNPDDIVEVVLYSVYQKYANFDLS